MAGPSAASSPNRSAGPIVIVGAGIIGSAIALESRARGVQVVLIDRDVIPKGASAFSFASLSALDEPLANVYLLKSLGMVGWRKWESRFGSEIGLRREGEIRWAETEKAAAHLRSIVARAVKRGYPVRMISKSFIGRRLPGSAPRGVFAASLAPEDAQVDPIRAMSTLKKAFVESGGELVVGKASLKFEEAALKVAVEDREISPSVVVIAIGAGTASLLERFGWEIPMDPSPGLLALTEPTDQVIRGTVYIAPARGTPIHLRQLSDGRVLVGERSQDHVARNPTEEHALRLLEVLRESFPVLSRVRLESFTVEWRPMPRDGMPIIGPMPGMPSLYVIATHTGVTLAPAVGELVAHELLEQVASPRLEPFRPARFAEHRADAYQSIEEAFQGQPDMFLP